jgi:NADH-quinone oxidoreductase subunit A
MSSYFAIGAVLGAGVLGIALLYGIAHLTSLEKKPLVVLPFQSGWVPHEHALSRFHARWYPLTLVFLAFDVEMLFMYPWAVVVGRLGAGSIIEMFVFLAVLMAAVIWAKREGAFRWV